MSASTDPKRIRRRDVEIGPTRRGIGAGRRLEHAHRRGADRHDPASRLARSRRSRLACAAGISYHSRWMWCSSMNSPSSGRKVSRPTCSVTLRARDATRLELSQQLRREVEARRSARRPTRGLRVDGLVALGRGGSVVDVRRQRHLAGRGHDGVRVAVEADRPDAVGEPLPHLDRSPLRSSSTSPTAHLA